MVANTTPIFTSVPKMSWSNNGLSTSGANVSAVNTGTTLTSYDGTTNAFLVFTADATDGSYVSKIIAEAYGTNAVSVARIHINNGSTNTTAINNALLFQYSLPATTAANTTATAHIEIPINLQLPPSYRIYVSLGAASNLAAGWTFTAIGGDY